MYQNLGEIYEGLQKTREKLIATVESLPPGMQDLRENGEGWSIKEIIEHLSIVEAGSLRITQKLLKKAKENPVQSDTLPLIPAEFLEKLESVRESKVQAPERVKPKGEQSLADSLVNLKKERIILEDLRAELENLDASVPTFPHPALGDLNVYQWIIMLGLHERRHLMQIKRILQDN